MILDRFAIQGRVAIVTGSRTGNRPGDRRRTGRGRCRRGRWQPEPSLISRRWPTRSAPSVDGPWSCPPTSPTQPRARDLVDAAVEEFGRLDILVNNAGGAMPRAAMDTSEGFMARTFAFNVTAPLTLTKLAARQMVDTVGDGAVVNISSRSASMTQTMFVAYGAAKAALDRMTRNIAAELAPRVRVNAIDVGGVATRSLDVVLTDEGLRRQFLEGTPMGRPGRARGHRLRRAVSRIRRLVVGDRQGLRGRRRDRVTGDAGSGARLGPNSGQPRRVLRARHRQGVPGLPDSDASYPRRRSSALTASMSNWNGSNDSTHSR